MSNVRSAADNAIIRWLAETVHPRWLQYLAYGGGTLRTYNRNYKRMQRARKAAQ